MRIKYNINILLHRVNLFSLTLTIEGTKSNLNVHAQGEKSVNISSGCFTQERLKIETANTVFHNRQMKHPHGEKNIDIPDAFFSPRGSQYQRARTNAKLPVLQAFARLYKSYLQSSLEYLEYCFIWTGINVHT